MPGFIARLIERFKSINLSSRTADLLLLVSALLAAAGIKTWLVAAGVVPFNSDEAVVALMARHILAGERPIFFYGQVYMGSLDAWLVAIGFHLFGEVVWVIRLVQGLLYLALQVSTVKVGELALGSRRVGVLGAWFLAAPSVIVTLYTTVSLGGYGEALLMGNLMLITSLLIVRDIRENRPPRWWLWLVWGGLAGLGVWVFGLSLVFSIPTGLLLLWCLWAQNQAAPRPRQLLGWAKWGGLTVVGSLLGALPWWIFALQHGFRELLAELSGSAIAGVEPTHWLLRIGQHFSSLLIFGGTAAFGLRPSWELRWLALPLLPFALAFWMGVLAHIGWRVRFVRSDCLGVWVLVGILVTLALGFVFTPFGADPSGRYFVPWVVPLSLFAAEMINTLRKRYGPWIRLLAVLIICYNAWGTVQCARTFPPGLTTQFDPVAQVDHNHMETLMTFLREKGETRGYTNYWVAYPLAFHSNEELIFVPRLPYHTDFRYTDRDDRYQPYQEMVTDAERVAYITTHNPPLDEYLHERFYSLELTWKEADIGDYHLYYELSRPVRPGEIGLGETTQP